MMSMYIVPELKPEIVDLEVQNHYLLSQCIRKINSYIDLMSNSGYSETTINEY